MRSLFATPCPFAADTRLRSSLRLVSLCVLAALPVYVSAQTSTDSEDQRHRIQQESVDRASRQQAPDIRLQPASPVSPATLDLPEEQPCFAIRQIVIEGDRFGAFHWLDRALTRYEGRCIGRQGIGLIIERATAEIVARGYVTTRIGLPEQDLGTGVLRLVLVPGVIGAIRIKEEEDGTHGWRSAFPVRPGDLLNLRDIEQGLEQMKRVPSQDVDIDIAPGDVAGESNLILTVKRTRPWRFNLSADDSGVKATGKLQTSANLAFDNLLGLNDLLNLSANDDLENRATRLGSSGYGLQYSVPWGNWTTSLLLNSYAYHQTVQGANQTFISSGKTRSQELRIQRLLDRDQTSKTSLQFRTLRREQHSYIDDTEIEIQNRVTAAAEIALIRRQYFGEAQLDINLAHRQGVRWFSGFGDAIGHSPDAPTYEYTLNTLDLALIAPFKIAEMPLKFNSVFHGQSSHDVLYTTEQIAIGGRYTVRGFDGETTLSAERGWFWRNELEIPVATSGQSLFVGIDHGEVSGPSAAQLIGRRLTGAVIGLRGRALGLSYELFNGWALERPQGFATDKPTFGFQIFFQY